MPESRSELARRIARYIGLRRLRRQHDLRELLNDAESIAWELERTAPAHVSAAAIAYRAVQRVRVRRIFKESIRSVTSDKRDKRSRPKLQRTHIRLTDLASRDTSPSDCVPGWMDYQTWIAAYDDRKRAIANALAVGGSTSQVSSEFNVTPGRIAQMRREFERDWNEFQS